MHTEAILRTDQLVVGHRGKAILPPVDLAIMPGELWVVAGRNGSGKSTLLKTLLGLLPPISGVVLRHPEADLAYIPQSRDLDPIVPMRGYDVVAEGVEKRWSFLSLGLSQAQKGRVERALKLTGTRHLARTPFQRLSEGQKQKILLAQALTAAPQLMLLDEPTSAMDMSAEQDAIELLDGIRQELGTAIVLISHHLPAAIKAADRLLFVDADHHEVVVGSVRDVAGNQTFRRQFSGLTGQLDLPPEAPRG